MSKTPDHQTEPGHQTEPDHESEPGHETPSSALFHIIRLIGVYDAHSTLRGELAYFVGARLGRRHCSLCDITHGLVRQRPEWKACRAGLPVPFDTYHRNDQPTAVADLLNGVAPAVVAESADGMVLLLGPNELDRCDGSIEALVAAIESAAHRSGLGWTAESAE